jgi:hypothetical protein
MLEKVDKLIEEAVRASGLSRSQVLMRAGVDPAQLRKYQRQDWALSDGMIEGLATIPGFPPEDTLKMWRLLDEESASVIQKAAEYLKEHPEAARESNPERYARLKPEIERRKAELRERKGEG